eukprot:SAG31_NODE_37549_length_303_cov_0.828431_1_plen_42_part_10
MAVFWDLVVSSQKMTTHRVVGKYNLNRGAATYTSWSQRINVV